MAIKASGYTRRSVSYNLNAAIINMLRTIPIWTLLLCSAVLVADSKPLFVKVFAPISGSSSASVQSSASVTPVNNQLISNLISSKIQLLNNFLQAKSSFGGFAIRKEVTFNSGSTTTTLRPVTQDTTEVNTDFIPDVSSSTQSVYTTTTDVDFETPKPTVHPVDPIATTTQTPVIPTRSTTESSPDITTRSTSSYTYPTPTATPTPTPAPTPTSTLVPISTPAPVYTTPAPIPTSTPTSRGYTYQPPTPGTSLLPASQQ